MPTALPNLSTLRRNSRFNPLRSLTAQSLTIALEGFEAGDLRNAALMWDAMCKRDDTISSVKAKREKSVSNRDWQILTSDDTPDAEKHKTVLEEFWNNITAVNAYDRNERGGVARLVRQMMEAASFRYAAHHIVWKPSRGKLTAEFEYVPLWFFENHTGELRFIQDGLGYEGTAMDAAEWVVTCGDGVMIAGSIAYFAKRLSLTDWLTFSEKFGMPGVLGRTNQGKDTDAGAAMASAVESFSNDWAAVIYGDDGTVKDPIQLITASGSSSTLPFPELIERLDRKLAALYRGADLSSMSAGQGAGDGASLQGDESDILEADDARMVSESIQRIERQVIEWHFGRGVQPLAYFQIILPQREDMKLKLDAVKQLHAMNVPLGIADLRETFGIATPASGEETTQPPPAKQQPAAGNPEPGTAPPDVVQTNAHAWELALTDFIASHA